MPTEELAQALDEAAVAGAESSLVEVLERLFKADRALIARILYAARYARDEELHLPRWGDAELDPELEEAIKRSVEDGLRRVKIRKAVLDKTPLTIPVQVLISNPKDICRGCPESLPCLSQSISTPEKCFATRKAELPVLPVRLDGNRVSVKADQPMGNYEVSVRDFCLPRPYRPKKDR